MEHLLHEILPNSYLITLAPGPADALEAALAHELRSAERSRKSQVWIDCGPVPTLSDEAVRLLWASHHRLQARHARLVLVSVAEPVRSCLQQQHLGPLPSMVPTLREAVRQAGECPVWPLRPQPVGQPAE